VLRLFRHYLPRTLLTFTVVDVGIIIAALALARTSVEWVGAGALWPKATLLAGLVLGALHLADLYGVGFEFGRRELIVRLTLALGGSAVAVAVLGFAIPSLRFGRLAFLEIFLVVYVGLALTRLAWHGLSVNDRLRRRVLVLGVSRAAPMIVRLQTSGSQPFSVLGFLSDEPDAYEALPPGYDLLGKVRDFLSLVDELQPDLVLVALREMRGAFPAAELLQCRLLGIQVEDWATFHEKQTGKVLVTDVRPSWLIFSDGFVRTKLTRALKRGADIALASIGAVCALPVMGVIALAIKLESEGPALFRQERVGENGRIFVLNKFRSMYIDAERSSGAVWAVRGDPRVTRVGRILRTTRLDELPQLINVLLGDMSFIGPRPERPEFVRTLQQQIPFYMERLSVKPGITGWAQVRHHYAASVEDTLEKLQYDLYYIKNLSLFLDFVILLSTVQVVLFGRGAR
jgi:sugar transferase (PEP-CTERM system associated)